MGRASDAPAPAAARGTRVALAVGAGCVGVGALGALAACWVCDDAYISFRYARNLVEGLGLVFNPGERVEGYTNFLWTLWSALALWLGIDPAAWAQAWGVACYAAAIALLVANHLRLRRAAGASSLTLPVAAIVAALHSEWTVYATGGLETSCFTLLALVGMLSLARDAAPSRRRLLGSGVVLGLASLTRPDGMIFAAVGGLFVVVSAARARRSWLREGLVFALGVAALWLPHMLWRIHYYGELVPNTYYAKSAARAWYAQGWIYLRLFFTKYWILIPALPAAWIALRRRPTSDAAPGRALAVRQATLASGFALAYAAYVTRVGGDFMYGRMLVPIVPCLALLLELGLFPLRRWAHWAQPAAATTVALALVLAPQPIVGTTVLHGIANEPAFYAEETIAATNKVAPLIARYLRGLDVTVAFSGAEARLMYLARVPRAIEAETGLTDPTVARQPLQTRGRIGHEKHASLDYLLGERKALLAFQPHTVRIAGGAERLPKVPISFDGAIGFLLHWNPTLMAELRRRGARFRDFPSQIDRVIRRMDRLPRERVADFYARATLFYFDHVDDPARRAAFERRLSR